MRFTGQQFQPKGRVYCRSDFEFLISPEAHEVPHAIHPTGYHHSVVMSWVILRVGKHSAVYTVGRLIADD